MAGAPAATPAPSAEALASSEALPALTDKQAHAYLSFLAPSLVGRSLVTAEQEQIKAARQDAIAKILGGWTKDPGLGLAARAFIESRLSVGGDKTDIDFDLPGTLAEQLARKNLPWSQVITSDTCFDRMGKAIACDSGAPFTAGVLTTRAYLVGNASRFNLTRARIMMKTFSCRVYPMDTELQPRLMKEQLIPIFRAERPEEQTDQRAVNGFGNGFGCYTCHSQFGAHAQLFVRFDQTGVYRADATGLQDPKGELGRSLRGLMTSHFVMPDAAKSEVSTMFGERVASLREAALVLARHKVFTECAVERLLRFGGDLGDALELPAAPIAAIAGRTRTGGKDPSFGELIQATFSDPWVVRSLVAGILQGGK